MKIKTNSLTGVQLDWIVAKCEGYECEFDDEVSGPWLVPQEGYLHDEKPLAAYSPSTNWHQGGPILRRERPDLTLWANESDENLRWQAIQFDTANVIKAEGPTALVAAMRCYVASKLGDVVEIPEELL